MRSLALLTALAVCLPQMAWADSADAISRNVLTSVDGAVIYQTMCQGCHMADGKGAVAAARFPSLSGNVKLASGGYPAYVVANGLGGMPWFADKLNDIQIAAVVNYVRTHFGNHYSDEVKTSDVAAVRPAVEATRPTFD